MMENDNVQWDQPPLNDMRPKDDPRPTSELAADVREGLRPPKPTGGTEWDVIDTNANAALDALVARVTDLEDREENLCERLWICDIKLAKREARVADLEAREESAMFIAEGWKRQFNEAEAKVRSLAKRLAYSQVELGSTDEKFTAAEAQVAELSRNGDPDYHPRYQDEYQRLWHEAAAKLEAAEAQVAALTQECDMARAARDQWQRGAEGRGRVQYELLARAEAAEAALATTRQALAEIAHGDSFGSIHLQDIARRALAATEPALAEANEKLSRLANVDSMWDTLVAHDTAVSERDEAVRALAEARQALAEIAELDGHTETKPLYFGLLDALHSARAIARRALAATEPA